jgi:hypothetical protein
MRVSVFLAALLMLPLAAPVFAEEWIEFTSQDDRFTCNFPGQPDVRDTTFRSEYGVNLPARMYTANVGRSRYSMTVVDYNYAEKLHAEKAKACAAAAAGADCRTARGGVERWKEEIAGAITYGTWQLIQRDVKVTLLLTSWMDWVEGHHIQLTNNADKSRTYGSIYMHQNRLYIMEGTVPPGDPEPALFQQSLGWIDENGKGVRYQSPYRNGYPAPPRVNR